MSLVGCLTADMKYTMDSSGAEDEMANITNRLNRLREESAEVGKALSNIETRIYDGRTTLRNLGGYQQQAMFAKDANALAAVEQNRSQAGQAYQFYQMQRMRLEAEKRKLVAQESQLVAQQTAAKSRYDFATKAKDMFSQMGKGAIERMFKM